MCVFTSLKVIVTCRCPCKCFFSVRSYLAPPPCVTSGCNKNQDGDDRNAKLKASNCRSAKPMSDVTVARSTSYAPGQPILPHLSSPHPVPRPPTPPLLIGIHSPSLPSCHPLSSSPMRYSPLPSPCIGLLGLVSSHLASERPPVTGSHLPALDANVTHS